MITICVKTDEIPQAAYHRIIAECRGVLQILPSRKYSSSEFERVANDLETFLNQNRISGCTHSRWSEEIKLERRVSHLKNLYRRMSTLPRFARVDMVSEKVLVYKSDNIENDDFVDQWQGDEPGRPYWLIALAVVAVASAIFFIVKRRSG